MHVYHMAAEYIYMYITWQRIHIHVYHMAAEYTYMYITWQRNAYTCTSHGSGIHIHVYHMTVEYTYLCITWQRNTYTCISHNSGGIFLFWGKHSEQCRIYWIKNDQSNQTLTWGNSIEKNRLHFEHLTIVSQHYQYLRQPCQLTDLRPSHHTVQLKYFALVVFSRIIFPSLPPHQSIRRPSQQVSSKVLQFVFLHSPNHSFVHSVVFMININPLTHLSNCPWTLKHPWRLLNTWF